MKYTIIRWIQAGFEPRTSISIDEVGASEARRIMTTDGYIEMGTLVIDSAFLLSTGTVF